MGRHVTLVTGPPCAGKTTYVHRNARPGDLVLDQDVIGAAAMNRGIEHVTRMTTGTAWVIRCCPGGPQRDLLADRIQAGEVVVLVPPDHVLYTRARARPQAARHVQAIKQWKEHEAAGGTPAFASDPVHVPHTVW